MINLPRQKNTNFLYLICSVIFLTIPSHAVVFTNNLNNNELGWTSALEQQQASSEVILSSTSVVNRIDWFGFFTNGSFGGAFRVRIFDDVGGKPVDNFFYDSVIENFSVSDTDQNPKNKSFSNFDILSYSGGSIDSVTLQSGKKYWLSIVAETGGNFIWSHSFSNRGVYLRSKDSGNWFFNNKVDRSSHAFSLSEQPIPEPVNAISLILGLFFGYFYQRKQKCIRD